MASFRTLPVMALTLITAVMAMPATAQVASPSGFEQLPRIGVGYVANAPNMFLGGNAWFVTDLLGGLGVYVDFKTSTSSPRDGADFIDSLTVEDVEGLIDHEFNFDEQAWWSVNAALVRPISPELMLYLGAGYTDEEVYRRYSTSDPDFGMFGHYWIVDDQASAGRVNVLGGAIIRIMPNVALHFGGELAPSGFTVGGSYSVPLR